MFDRMLPVGSTCEIADPAGPGDLAPGMFRVRGAVWRVVAVEAMWREWRLGGGDGRGSLEDVADLEMWRVRARRHRSRDPADPEDVAGAEAVVVLARDLVAGGWSIHSVWD